MISGKSVWYLLFLVPNNVRKLAVLLIFTNLNKNAVVHIYYHLIKNNYTSLYANIPGSKVYGPGLPGAEHGTPIPLLAGLLRVNDRP